MDTAFMKLKELIRKSYWRCQKEEAWKEKYKYKFNKCTQQLINRSWLEGVFADVEKFAASQHNSTMSAEIQIGEVLEEAYKTPFGSNGLNLAIAYIKDHSASPSSDNPCSLLPGCPETVRKTLLQLMMINWGILGLADASAGAFLAYHYSSIGPYFGRKNGHEWPQNPLGKDPTLLEEKFNKQLMEITKILSRGNFSDVSILDFPAFGSKIAWLEKRHKRESNWPTEINFETLKVGKKRLPAAFRDYKILLSHWKKYMIKVFKKDSQASFTPEMENNQDLNFTKYIRADMDTFLISMHGSFLSTSEQAHPIWNQVAEKVFNETVDNFEKGFYDKLIMECEFGLQNLLTKDKFNNNGGCDLLKPILTTNGHCYTFNAQSSSVVWKNATVMKRFDTLFSWNQQSQYFRGATAGDGEHFKI